MMGAGNGTGLAVVAQPRPTVVQQKSFCAWDHEFSIIAALPKPASQSNGRDEDEPDSSQQSKGMSNKRLLRQMMQVKSLLGRTTSKSPPHPTYLYVVSCTYSPWPAPTYDRAPPPAPPPHATPHAVHSSPGPTPQATPLPAGPRAPPTYPPPGPATIPAPLPAGPRAPPTYPPPG